MRFKKSVLTGVVALGTMIGATAASAAPVTVSGNDTIWKIAQQHGIDLNSLVSANPQVANPNVIWPGMKLQLPAQAPAQAPTKAAAPAPAPANNAQQQPASETATSAYASQVVTLVNQERAKAGLQPLAEDKALSAMALDKAKDMYHNGYFDHNSPTYGSPFDMMKSYGINYTYAGENIAKGQRTPQEVMNGWMNSPGHKQNILSPNFTKIGVAYYNGEWVQEFIAN
ncbi:CAP domain-containing protein [Paenibacillus xerothermodurans]|uniref:LysM peptidoglycan-binding domain-containing protein n=1 Tax=Paenibacillus xerothermodurans TaxID=1977292 RepID=A0A2W1NJN3_PAEXE|nr:CAP domain-containing protein [Paenibacillus xerothermodurans]PZE19685.1 LysM peptidoglycan-binding domain-containing protein [Paenibacillus xerothermodurans]